MKAEGFLLTIAQAPSYIPGGPRSFWSFIGLLLQVIGVLVVLWLSWVGLRWIIKKLSAAFRGK
jgi:hypothetical protein